MNKKTKLKRAELLVCLLHDVALDYIETDVIEQKSRQLDRTIQRVIDHSGYQIDFKKCWEVYCKLYK